VLKTAVGLNDGGQDSEPLSSGGALCPLSRGQLTRERQQGLENFSFRHHPVSFGCKRNGVVSWKTIPPSASQTPPFAQGRLFYSKNIYSFVIHFSALM
jgi:hypothetical protein